MMADDHFADDLSDKMRFHRVNEAVELLRTIRKNIDAFQYDADARDTEALLDEHAAYLAHKRTLEDAALRVLDDLKLRPSIFQSGQPDSPRYFDIDLDAIDEAINGGEWMRGEWMREVIWNRAMETVEDEDADGGDE